MWTALLWKRCSKAQLPRPSVGMTCLTHPLLQAFLAFCEAECPGVSRLHLRTGVKSSLAELKTFFRNRKSRITSNIKKSFLLMNSSSLLPILGTAGSRLLAASCMEERVRLLDGESESFVHAYARACLTHERHLLTVAGQSVMYFVTSARFILACTEGKNARRLSPMHLALGFSAVHGVPMSYACLPVGPTSMNPSHEVVFTARDSATARRFSPS
jgi:hypothetical protein